MRSDKNKTLITYNKEKNHQRLQQKLTEFDWASITLNNKTA